MTECQRASGMVRVDCCHGDKPTQQRHPSTLESWEESYRLVGAAHLQVYLWGWPCVHILWDHDFNNMMTDQNICSKHGKKKEKKNMTWLTKSYKFDLIWHKNILTLKRMGQKTPKTLDPYDFAVPLYLVRSLLFYCTFPRKICVMST